MKREDFKSLVANIGALSDRSIKLYELGFDLIEFEDDFHRVIEDLGVEAFGKKVWDEVEYYLYDAPKDGKACMWDKDNKEIPLNDLDDLCNFLESSKLIEWE